MEELVEKAKKGDNKAFSELIIGLENDLYKIAKIRLNDENNIEDAVQETILDAFKHIRKLRNNKFFKTWIIRILINNCNQIYRKNSKENFVDESILENKYFSEDNTKEIDSKLDFFILLEGLNYNEKIAISLYYLYDFSNKEIAKILRIPVGTVKNRISRARKKIKDRMEGNL